MTATNITRNKAIEGLENFGLFQPYFTVGKYEIPTIAPVYELPTLKWIDFSAARSFRGSGKEIGVHFFTDDYRFNSVWLQAAKYSEMPARFGAILAPDFSMYRDMPKSLQIYNHYRKHWCAQFWQNLGATVIPTISWSDSASWDFCFDGEPTGSIVAVSTVGVRRDKEALGLFAAGYSEMLDRLQPTRVLCCGDVLDFMATDVIVEQFGAFCDKFKNFGKEE